MWQKARFSRRNRQLSGVQPSVERKFFQNKQIFDSFFPQIMA
jgi:hypothetical protein